MAAFTMSGETVFKPVDDAGNPRGANMDDVQTWAIEVERLTTLAFASGLVYDTRADLYANLVPGARTPALVIGDPTAGYDGIYMKVGATTTGSWTRLGDVPGYNVVRFSNAGAGSANAIVATAGGAVSTVAGAQIYTLNITANNTGNVTLNGRALLTSSGNQIAANGLVTGMNVVFIDNGTTYRLLSDQASAAVMAAVEAMVAEAEGFRDEAEVARDAAAASAILAATYDPTVRFPNVTAMLASVRAAVGAGTVWQGGKWLYQEVASGEHVTTANGVKLRILDPVPSVEAFGVVGGATTVYPLVTIANGDTTLTISTSSFPASIVGKTIMVNGAGVGGAPLVTTVASRTSATEVELTDAASTTISGVMKNITFGVDESALFQACANAFLSWELPPGSYIASGMILRSGAKIVGGTRQDTKIYRIADEPIFKASGAGTASRNQELAVDGMYLYGRGATDTARVVDFRGVSNLITDNFQIIGDPIGTGAISTAQCIGLDITRAGAEFCGYIDIRNTYIWYCDIGFDAEINQLTLTGGFLNANTTWGGRFTTVNCGTIIGTEISSNARNQTAAYVGTFPDGHYDRGGLLVQNCFGVTGRSIWHENNANRLSSAVVARNDVFVKSDCIQIDFGPGRPQVGSTVQGHGLSTGKGVSYRNARSHQSDSAVSRIINGRLERTYANGDIADWTMSTVKPTVGSTSLLPTGVKGRRFTHSATGFQFVTQQVLSYAECQFLIGQTVSVTAWIVTPTSSWDGGTYLRIGLNTAVAPSASGSSYLSVQSTGNELSRYTFRHKITGAETNGLHFSMITNMPGAIWEIGDISGGIGETTWCDFERPVTTGDGPLLRGTATTHSTDAALTYSPVGHNNTLLLTSALSTNRTVTLGTAFSRNGDEFDFVISNAGVYNWTIAGVALRNGTVGRCRIVGGAWTLIEAGSAGAGLRNDLEDQTLAGGWRVTSKSLGTQTTGTLTLDPGDRPLQHYVNGGAHTLAPGANAGEIWLDITNNGSAGAITTSGWTKVGGDSFTTTNGHKFRCKATIGDAGSLLTVYAMQ